MSIVLAWAAALAFGAFPALLCTLKRRWGGAGLGTLLTAGAGYLALVATGLVTDTPGQVFPFVADHVSRSDVLGVGYVVLLLASLVVWNEAIAHARPGSWWYRRRYDEEQRRFADFAVHGLRDRSPGEQAINTGSRDHVADRLGGRRRGRPHDP